jgi:hypothetical protein
MKTGQFQVGRENVLQLRHIDSDAAVKGWDADTVELTVDGEWEECVVEQQENMLVIDSHVPFSVSAPHNMVVHIVQVHGDLVLYDLDGAVSVDQVDGECALHSGAATMSIRCACGGLVVEGVTGPLNVNEARADLRLTDVGAPVVLGQVGGDVRVRDVGGPLKMGMVGGDVRARQVDGLLTLEEAGGDFKGVDLEGGMSVHLVKGDLSLKTLLTPGMTYAGRANGDVVVRVPADASARFTLEAQNGISTRLLRVEEKESDRVVGQMGDGEAQVTLWAGQHLSLKPSDAWEEGGEGFSVDLGEEIATQVDARIAEQLEGLDLDETIRGEVEMVMRKAWGKAAESRRFVLEQARQAEERAHRAEERMRKAQEKIQRKAEQIARKAERRARRKARTWSVSLDTDRKAARRQVSEEEQLSILRMLQEGKITTEEAEMLLKALEG